MQVIGRKQLIYYQSYSAFSRGFSNFSFNDQSQLSKISNDLINTYKNQKGRVTVKLFPRNQVISRQFEFELGENVFKSVNQVFKKDTKSETDRKEKNTKLIHVFDNSCSEDITKILCNLVTVSGLSGFFSSPGERKISLNLDNNDLEEILSSQAVGILAFLTQLIKSKVELEISPHVLHAGSILSWLSTPASYNRLNDYGYWDMHCDKANNFEYDITALLYLNSYPSFQGGNLVFVEDNKDMHLEPKPGRLVIFDSSLENIHRVEPVSRGDRFLLSVWFSKIN